MMKMYRGERAPNGTVRVFVDEGDQRRSLGPARRYPSSGFDYGYDGSGPAELARSILADVLGRPPKWWLYRAVLGQFIEPLDQAEPWAISEAEVSAWLAAVAAQR